MLPWREMWDVVLVKSVSYPLFSKREMIGPTSPRWTPVQSSVSAATLLTVAKCSRLKGVAQSDVE